MIRSIKSSLVDALRVLCAVAFLLYAGLLGYQFVTGRSPLAIVEQLRPQTANAGSRTPCSSRSPLALSGSGNAQLDRLNEYQQACHSYVTGTMMTFVGIPSSDGHAAAEARLVASTLKEFASHHVRPIVMAEPTDYISGRPLDVASLADGTDSSHIAALFADLQHDGIKTNQMGIWNPFPEANIPEWKDNQQQYFAPSVNNFVAALEQRFPGTPTSVMLNAQSYQPGDTGLKDGQYTSLLPYLKGITPGTIDYAGIEGFPWLPPHFQQGAALDPSVFLDPSLITAAANYLGTHNIWLNTGTFSAQYTQDPDHTVQLSAAQRQIILSGIDSQAIQLQKEGYKVSINLFSQDKSNEKEAVDWAYWSGNNPSGSSGTPVFTSFVRTLNRQHVGLWLFDQ